MLFSVFIRCVRCFSWFQVVKADQVVLVAQVVQIVDRCFTLFWVALLCVTLFWIVSAPELFKIVLFFLFSLSVAVDSSCPWLTHFLHLFWIVLSWFFKAVSVVRVVQAALVVEVVQVVTVVWAFLTKKGSLFGMFRVSEVVSFCYRLFQIVFGCFRNV